MTRSGLRARLRSEGRRIAGQHHQLDLLFAAVREALDQRTVHTAAHAFERCVEALEAHLSLEEAIHFPALHGLCPGLVGELRALIAEHTAIRSESGRIALLMRGGEAELSSERLDGLVHSLVQHEAREELLMASALERDEGLGTDE